MEPTQESSLNVKAVNEDVNTCTKHDTVAEDDTGFGISQKSTEIGHSSLTDEETECSKINITEEMLSKSLAALKNNDPWDCPLVKNAHKGLVVFRFTNEVTNEEWEKSKHSIMCHLMFRYKMGDIGPTITLDENGKKSKILSVCFRTCEDNIVSLKFITVNKRPLPKKVSLNVTDNEFDENGELNHDKLFEKCKKDFFGNKSLFCIDDSTLASELSNNFKCILNILIKNAIIDGLEFNDGTDVINEEIRSKIEMASRDY